MSNITPLDVIRIEVLDVSIYRFIWQIDETNADSTFRKIFDELEKQDIIFDLWWLTYGNSRFLGYLSKLNDHINERKWKIFLVNCKEPFRDVLEVCWIFQIIEMLETIEEALLRFWVDKSIIDEM